MRTVQLSKRCPGMTICGDRKIWKLHFCCYSICGIAIYKYDMKLVHIWYVLTFLVLFNFSTNLHHLYMTFFWLCHRAHAWGWLEEVSSGLPSLWKYKVVVGKFRKTCHPRNVELYEIREMSFQEFWTCEDLESWTCEAPKSWTCEDLESWTCEAPKLRTCEDLKSWTCKTTKSGVCEIWESARGWVRKSRSMKISWMERFTN
jgi:hypothetical protein